MKYLRHVLTNEFVSYYMRLGIAITKIEEGNIEEAKATLIKIMKCMDDRMLEVCSNNDIVLSEDEKWKE